jgi:hypothetical protein
MWFTRRQQPTVMGLWYAAQGLYPFLSRARTVLTSRCRYRSRRNHWLRNRSDQSRLASLAIRIHHHRVRRHLQTLLICRIACAVWAIVMGIIIPDSPYSMLDVKTYLYFFLGLTANIPNGGTSNFGTLMTQGFGFNTLQTTLLQSRSINDGASEYH